MAERTSGTPGTPNLGEGLILPPDLGRPTRLDDPHVDGNVFDQLRSINAAVDALIRSGAGKVSIAESVRDVVSPATGIKTHLDYHGGHKAALADTAQKSPLEGLSPDEVREYVEPRARERAESLFKELKSSIENYVSEAVSTLEITYERQRQKGGELLIHVQDLKTRFEGLGDLSFDSDRTDDHPRSIFRAEFLRHLGSLLNAHVRSKIRIVAQGMIQDNSTIKASLDFDPTPQDDESPDNVHGHLRYGFDLGQNLKGKKIEYPS